MRSVSACAITFTKPAGSSIATARPIAANGKLPVLYGDAFVLELLLGLADPGDLRLGVDHPRHGVELTWPGRPAISSATAMPSSKPLCASIGAAHAVADRPDAFDAGLAVLVDFDAAALVELARRCLRPSRPLRRGACGRRRPAACRRRCVFSPSFVGVGHVDFLLALDLGLADLRAELDVEALLLEFARGGLRDSASAVPRNSGSASRIVTSAPRRFQTLPSSRPITPAPITPRRLGTSSIRARRRCRR